MCSKQWGNVYRSCRKMRIILEDMWITFNHECGPDASVEKWEKGLVACENLCNECWADGLLMHDIAGSSN